LAQFKALLARFCQAERAGWVCVGSEDIWTEKQKGRRRDEGGGEGELSRKEMGCERAARETEKRIWIWTNK